MRIDKSGAAVLLSLHEKDSAHTRTEVYDDEHVVVVALGSRRL